MMRPCFAGNPPVGKEQAMSIDGNWSITMNTPMGAQKGTLTLKSSGAALEGKLEGPQGALPISNGKVSGDSATWTCDMTQPMPMKLEFSAKVDGDKISGEVALGAFGKASFSGTRA
jgi:hypothetical protein